MPILLQLVRAKQLGLQAESKNRAEDPSEVSLPGATAPSGDGSDKLAKENTDTQVEAKVAEQQQPSAPGQREDATEDVHAQDPPQSQQATGDANSSSRLADSVSYDYEDDYEDDNDFERPISEEAISRSTLQMMDSSHSHNRLRTRVPFALRESWQ